MGRRNRDWARLSDDVRKKLRGTARRCGTRFRPHLLAGCISTPLSALILVDCGSLYGYDSFTLPGSPSSQSIPIPIGRRTAG